MANYASRASQTARCPELHQCSPHAALAPPAVNTQRSQFHYRSWLKESSSLDSHIAETCLAACEILFLVYFSLFLATMPVTQKLYPRATVKRIVKAHSNRSVSKNADILVSRSPIIVLQM